MQVEIGRQFDHVLREFLKGPSINVDIFSYDNSYRKSEGGGRKMLITIINFMN